MALCTAHKGNVIHLKFWGNAASCRICRIIADWIFKHQCQED